jgi:hypothetical protein
MIVVTLFQKLKPEPKSSSSLDFTSREHIWEAPIPGDPKEILLELTHTSTSKMEAPIPKSAAALEEDKRLRIFDEL